MILRPVHDNTLETFGLSVHPNVLVNHNYLMSGRCDEHRARSEPCI